MSNTLNATGPITQLRETIYRLKHENTRLLYANIKLKQDYQKLTKKYEKERSERLVLLNQLAKDKPGTQESVGIDFESEELIDSAEERSG